jgi:hypothetical protein
MQIHPLRLLPGQDLRQQLQAYVHQYQLQAAFVVTCCGSLTRYHLRFADQAVGQAAEGHFEIVSLTGTLSIHGMHLHMSVADEQGRTTGGHLLEGNLIYTTAEIVLGESEQHVFIREKDGSTAWEELQIRKRH